MSKSKATGPLPSQILDPPVGKDPTVVPTDGGETKPAEDPDDEARGEDVLDRRAATAAPSQGAVARFQSVAMPPFNPLGAGTTTEASPSAKPMFPGLVGMMQRQQAAQAPAAAPPPAAEPSRPGGTRYRSDEQMARDALSDYADDLIVTAKVHRVEDAGETGEIGLVGPMPMSVGRDFSNFIDVSGEWIVYYRMHESGKWLTKPKRGKTEGPDYYQGWRPRLLRGGDSMDPKLMGTTVGEVMKALGIQVPVVAQGQPGVQGVPFGIHQGDITRMQDDLRELKTERTGLLAKLETKTEEIAKLRQDVTTLTMRLEFANSRPKDDGGSKTSDAVQIAQAFASLSKKDDQTGMWQAFMQSERDHSKAMLDIALKGKGGQFDDKVQQGWATLFDGAQKLAKAGSNETGEIAKAFGPVVAQWMAGQQQIQIEAMRLKAAEKGIHVQPQPPSPQPLPVPPIAAPQHPPAPPVDPKAAETAARIKHKADVFDAMFGAILHRAASPAVEAQPATATSPAVEPRPAATAEEIGVELAMAVRTAKYQELAEGHEQHERMLKTLLEDPVASVTELATVTGKTKEYAEAVVRKFVERYVELEKEATKPQTAAASPAPAVPSPKAEPAASVHAASPAPAPEVKAEGAAPGVVPKSDGNPNDGKGDGAGQAGGGVQGADDAHVPGEPGKGVRVN